MNPHGLEVNVCAAGPTDVELEQMKAHGITGYGTHYFFSGYRYSNLGDALSYAGLMREHPERSSRGHAAAGPETAAEPTGDERALMARLGIDLAAGTFRFGGFRYDRLEDAVAYAMRRAVGP